MAVNIVKFQDLHLADKALYNAFCAAMTANQISAAQAILSGSGRLKSASPLLAENMNSIRSALLELQQKPKTDIDEYLADLLLEFQSQIYNLRDLGEHDAQLPYPKMAFVKSASLVYFCIQNAPAGTEITDTGYWVLVGLRGERGICGLGVAFLGTWDATTAYITGDAVCYDNKLWIAKQPSTGTTPAAGDKWLLGLDPNAGNGIPVSVTVPENQPIGALWLQITQT